MKCTPKRNDTCSDVVTAKYIGQTVDLWEGVEALITVMQAVHHVVEIFRNVKYVFGHYTSNRSNYIPSNKDYPSQME